MQLILSALVLTLCASLMEAAEGAVSEAQNNIPVASGN